MKFTIERVNLLKSLSHVQSIVEKRNTIPVLSNVRIEATEDGISFESDGYGYRNNRNRRCQDALKPGRRRRRLICCMTSSANCPTVPTLS
ncbi:MAG: hypothetical protein ACLSHR_11715 [Oscillospiraceae bacterium]